MARSLHEIFDESGAVGAKIKLVINQRRDEAQRMMDEADEWEQAWRERDWDYLVSIGVIERHEV